MARSLSEEETQAWAECRQRPGLELQPDVVIWEEAQLSYYQLDVEEVNKDMICDQDQYKNMYFAFSHQLDLEGTEKFCRNVGGEIAVVSQHNSKQIKAAFSSVRNSGCKDTIYSGHRKTGGQWRDVNTGEVLTWTKWRGSRNYSSCSFYNLTGDFLTSHSIYHCQWELCPVCFIRQSPVEFQLRGSCLHTKIDPTYLLTSSKSLQGYTKSSIIWNEKNKSWNIVRDDTVVALMNNTNGRAILPIGVHPWYINSNCTDPGKTWRSLHLHLEVKGVEEGFCHL